MKSCYLFDFNESWNDYSIISLSCVPVLADFNAFADVWERNHQNKKVLLSFPNVSRETLLKDFKNAFHTLAQYFDGFLLQNIGDYGILTSLFDEHHLSRNNYFIAGDYSLNVFNLESAKFWSDKLDMVALSPELSIKEQSEIASKFPKNITPEIICSKRIIVMRSEHCYASENIFHCGRCGKSGLNAPKLKSENGKEYDVYCNPKDCTCVLVGTDFPIQGNVNFDLENAVYRTL